RSACAVMSVLSKCLRKDRGTRLFRTLVLDLHPAQLTAVCPGPLSRRNHRDVRSCRPAPPRTLQPGLLPKLRTRCIGGALVPAKGKPIVLSLKKRDGLDMRRP